MVTYNDQSCSSTNSTTTFPVGSCVRLGETSLKLVACGTTALNFDGDFVTLA